MQVEVMIAVSNVETGDGFVRAASVESVVMTHDIDANFDLVAAVIDRLAGENIDKVKEQWGQIQRQEAAPQ